jgi:hypothetical protein
LLRNDAVVASIPSDGPLPEAREQALDAINLFRADYALILDASGVMVDRIKRSA